MWVIGNCRQVHFLNVWRNSHCYHWPSYWLKWHWSISSWIKCLHLCLSSCRSKVNIWPQSLSLTLFNVFVHSVFWRGLTLMCDVEDLNSAVLPVGLVLSCSQIWFTLTLITTNCLLLSYYDPEKIRTGFTGLKCSWFPAPAFPTLIILNPTNKHWFTKHLDLNCKITAVNNRKHNRRIAFLKLH